MSVYDLHRKRMKSQGNTIGQIHKQQSDDIMEQTFENDIATKTCYIYDHFHDDFFTDEHGITRSLAEGMTYENTNKTKIDAKFIIKSYQSMDKDQVEYYLMFRPSQPVRFNEGDDLYYYETDFRKRYGATFPIGLFVDVPDDRGVYHKWIICRDEPANQFPKYLILPVNYELTWIEKSNDKRIKRRMWCCLRQQNSYTIGTYTDRYFTHTDNQDKIWLPMNFITEKFWYTSEDSKNMRVVVSALTEHPTVWTVTKVENSMPFGIQKLTIYTAFGMNILIMSILKQAKCMRTILIQKSPQQIHLIQLLPHLLSQQESQHPLQQSKSVVLIKILQ